MAAELLTESDLRILGIVGDERDEPEPGGLDGGGGLSGAAAMFVGHGERQHQRAKSPSWGSSP